jgi:TonB family protein
VQQPDYNEDIDLFRLAGIVSGLLHLILVVFISFSSPFEYEPTPPSETTIDVSFEQPLPAPLRRPPDQMVSPSDRQSTETPVETNRLSEEDASFKREQIRRGDQGGAAVANVPRNTKALPQPITSADRQPPLKKSQPKEPHDHERPQGKQPGPEKAERVAPSAQPPPAKLQQLTLDASTTMTRFGEFAPKADPKESLSAAIQGGGQSSPSGYKAFSRPAGSGAAFLGSGGVRDFLPGLPDGDITLLNAKASQYASFVRRVATQVFGLMRQTGWDQLRAPDIRQIGGFSSVRAVLSPSGQLLRVEVLEESGSTKFDRVLSEATKRGAKDPNPPPGAAASDGNIRMIFKSRSWVDIGSGGRSGGVMERRWLFLATGLE